MSSPAPYHAVSCANPVQPMYRSSVAKYASRRSAAPSPTSAAISTASSAAREAVSGGTPAAGSVASERLATISASRASGIWRGYAGGAGQRNVP